MPGVGAQSWTATEVGREPEQRQPVKNKRRGNFQGERPPELRLRVWGHSMETLAHGGQGGLCRVDDGSKGGRGVGKT